MSNVTIGPAGSGALPSFSGYVDGVNDLLPIYQNSTVGTYSLNRNTLLNIASQPVGSTDSQTLSNKTLTNPAINGATLSGTLSGTYTIGGTPTFPSSVATLTGTQTLTNKTLTSPTINSPSITNATITADAITGYTTANAGSIYGVSITGGNTISTAMTLSSTLGVTGLITASGGLKATGTLWNNGNPVWQYLGYAQITTTATSSSTSAAAVAGLSVNAIIPTGATAVKITVQCSGIYSSTANSSFTLSIWSGASSGTLTTQLNGSAMNTTSVSGFIALPGICVAVLKSPTPGSIYYTAAIQTGNASDAVNFTASSGTPAYILVECC